MHYLQGDKIIYLITVKTPEEKIVDMVQDSVELISSTHIQYPKIHYIPNEFNKMITSENLKLCTRYIDSKVNYRDNHERNEYFLKIYDITKMLISEIYMLHMYCIERTGAQKPYVYKYNVMELDQKIVFENLVKDIALPMVETYLLPQFNVIYDHSNKLFSLLESIVGIHVDYDPVGTSFTVGMSEIRFKEISSMVKNYVLYIEQYYANIFNTMQDLNLLQKIISNKSEKNLIIYSGTVQITNIMFYLIKHYSYEITNSLTISNISLVNSNAKDNYELYLYYVLTNNTVNDVPQII